jgi:hypothetical protein
VPVGVMTFKGLLLHVNDIRALAADSPDTKIIMDHFGFCKASDPDSEEWQALLSLAALPQVYVKVRACVPWLRPLRMCCAMCLQVVAGVRAWRCDVTCRALAADKLCWCCRSAPSFASASRTTLTKTRMPACASLWTHSARDG